MFRPAHFLQFTAMILIGLLLACAPLSQLAEWNRNSRAVATGVAVINQADFAALDAYQKLEQLPGYRLESKIVAGQGSANPAVTTVSVERDAAGNRRTVTSVPGREPVEEIAIGGQMYRFDRAQNGWLKLAAGETAGDQPLQFIPWLAQFGAVPTPVGEDSVQGRPATRYNLQYIVANLARAAGHSAADSAPRLSGALWVDIETGALLKADILLTGSPSPEQEFQLEVSQVGAIAPIDAPEPVVDPALTVSATATAQAWSALNVELPYQGQPVNLEIIPVRVRQASPNRTELQILLRNLPPNLRSALDQDSLLTALLPRLTLSIPQQNLTVQSDQFEIAGAQPDDDTVDARYFFDVNLADFEHVELIVTGTANPVFAPVPVEK